MKTAILTLSVAALVSACGPPTPEDVLPTGDGLEALDLGPGSRVTTDRADVLGTRASLHTLRAGELSGLGRDALCEETILVPSALGTIRSIPVLGVLEMVSTLPGEVQSGRVAMSRTIDEFRRGAVEFYVPGPVTTATLKFRERRGWTNMPLPTDTHAIVAYPANLEVNVDDYGAPAVVVGLFDSNPNTEPAVTNGHDVTRAVLGLGSKVGFRFEPYGTVSSGTAFTDLVLHVSWCRAITRER